MKTLGRERFLWRPRLAVTSLRSVERQVRPDLVRSHPAVQQSVGAQTKSEEMECGAEE